MSMRLVDSSSLIKQLNVLKDLYEKSLFQSTTVPAKCIVELIDEAVCIVNNELHEQRNCDYYDNAKDAWDEWHAYASERMVSRQSFIPFEDWLFDERKEV